jgi:hypothetical protein
MRAGWSNHDWQQECCLLYHQRYLVCNTFTCSPVHAPSSDHHIAQLCMQAGSLQVPGGNRHSLSFASDRAAPAAVPAIVNGSMALQRASRHCRDSAVTALLQPQHCTAASLTAVLTPGMPAQASTGGDERPLKPLFTMPENEITCTEVSTLYPLPAMSRKPR